MQPSPPTRASLLVRLRDSDDQLAWSEFVEIYSPLVFGYALSKGLQDADAADITQEVIAIVARQMPKFQYDPERGSFRGWLFTVTINAIRQVKNREKKIALGTGDTVMQNVLAQQPDEAHDEKRWDDQYDMYLFRWAAEQVKSSIQPKTWQAFVLAAIQNQPASDVAKQLGMTVGAIYIAKSRVIDRIRQKIASVEQS